MSNNRMTMLKKNLISFCKLSGNNGNKSIIRRNRSNVIPEIEERNLLDVLPYSEMPGPKAIPLLGNTWRFLPYIGITINRIFISNHIGFRSIIIQRNLFNF